MYKREEEYKITQNEERERERERERDIERR
jgi:hypothetical protein